ncbi:hypothetical protein MCOR03_008559 [Pyricularia oryzae]|nr:hypothetical protein MCOR18_008109 [Pyricularia oryzae]KAI6552085.1 hypothetical protein MCOR03_008559 [Pyricularia oryzae]
MSRLPSKKQRLRQEPLTRPLVQNPELLQHRSQHQSRRRPSRLRRTMWTKEMCSRLM